MKKEKNQFVFGKDKSNHIWLSPDDIKKHTFLLGRAVKGKTNYSFTEYGSTEEEKEMNRLAR